MVCEVKQEAEKGVLVGDKTPGERGEMKEHAGLGEEGKPGACVSRMRALGTGPADALSLWYFLALTPPQPPLPRPLLGFNDSLPTFPSFLGGRFQSLQRLWRMG